MTTLSIRPGEISFLIGLLAYTAGQFLIFVFFNDLEALHAQSPIDFAHWSMLIGVLLLVTQATHFPRSGWSLIGSPITILGIGLTVGMCVLDFVFWSIESPEQKRELAAHLIDTPVIWVPFMTLSGKIFNLGLLIASFSYYRVTTAGPLLVLTGAVIIHVGGGWLNVLGYIVLTAGFAVCFHRHRKNAPAGD